MKTEYYRVLKWDPHGSLHSDCLTTQKLIKNTGQSAIQETIDQA